LHGCCFDGELLLTRCTHDLLLGGESLKAVSSAPIGRECMHVIFCKFVPHQHVWNVC